MITIIAALPVEMSVFKNHLKPEFLENYGKNQSCYRSENIDLLICGVGPKKTHHAVNSYLKKNKPSMLINVGMAGILDPDYPVLKCINIQTVYSENSPNPFTLKVNPDFAAVTAVSVSSPVTDQLHADSLNKNFGAKIVDMECFTISSLAHEYHIPLYSYKITTDYADENAIADVIRIARRASAELFEKVSKIF